jgi:hypothetical protein
MAIEQQRIDKFVGDLNAEFILSRDPHMQDRFRGLLYELLNPEAAPKEPQRIISSNDELDALQKSSGVDRDAGDWTKTEGQGLTDDTAPSAADLDAIAAEHDAKTATSESEAV